MIKIITKLNSYVSCFTSSKSLQKRKKNEQFVRNRSKLKFKRKEFQRSGIRSRGQVSINEKGPTFLPSPSKTSKKLFFQLHTHDRRLEIYLSTQYPSTRNTRLYPLPRCLSKSFFPLSKERKEKGREKKFRQIPPDKLSKKHYQTPFKLAFVDSFPVSKKKKKEEERRKKRRDEIRPESVSLARRLLF